MIRHLCAFLLLIVTAFAQEDRSSKGSSVLQKGSSEWGIFFGGGTAFGRRSSTQFVYPGFRYGRVLTGDLGKAWYRGNFEWKVQVHPLIAVLQPPENAYGVEIQPLALHWNFVGTKKMKPYFFLSGGLLITNHDVPVNTNTVNFTPQGGMGFHFFTKRPKRAWTLEAKFVHVSNAGLERRNTGINASIHGTIGYTWFK